MSFRQYGGINYAARNNIVKNNYTNANNLSVMTKVGQPVSYINFESDISGNTIYGPYDFIGDVSINGNLSVGNISGSVAVSLFSVNGLTGNVGIGTTTPSKKLDVVGSDALINGLTIGKGGGNIITNTVIGHNSLYNNTIGSNNNAIGFNSLYSNIIGSNNNAIGFNSLYSNIIGSNNTAIGHNSLYINTIGSNNNAIGFNSLYSNTEGSNNNAIGFNSLSINTIGSNNNAIGYGSLLSNTTGWNNNAIGFNSLYSNTTGWDNNAIGFNSLYSNTEGSYNTAIGFNSLRSNTTGWDNNAIGYGSLLSNTTGSYNTAIGDNSLYSNTTGSYNTAIGYGSLFSNTTGSYNTAIGDNSNCSLNNLSNSTAIGANALITASNQIMLGGLNSSVYPAVSVPGTLDVTGATTLTSSLDVSGATTLTSSLNVSGATTLSVGLTTTEITFFEDNTIQSTAPDYPYYTTPDTIAFYCRNPIGFAFPPIFNIKPNYSAGTFKTWRIEVSVLISPPTYIQFNNPPVLQAYGIADWTYSNSGGSGQIAHVPIIDNLYVNGVKQTASMFGGPPLSPTTITIGTINGFNYGSFGSVFFLTFGGGQNAIQARFTFSQNNFTGTGTSQVELQACARVMSSSPFNYVAGSTGAYTFSPNFSNMNNGGGGGFWTS